MKHKDTAFAPDERIDFGEALLPPEGYRLEAALGTTFSLDFLTALTVPVSLALRGGIQRDELLSSPLAALAAMRRLEDRLAIFVEAGNIHSPKGKRTPLVTLLESIVKEVPPPRNTSFHPKLWLLRFAPEHDGPMRQRLIMMSRNLTRDRSWDVAVQLDGEERQSVRQANMPIVELLDWLPVPKTSKHLRALRNGLQYVNWDRIPGFSSPIFHSHFPTSTRAQWRPVPGKLAVISPFCDEEGLDSLGIERITALVASDDWLAGLKVHPPKCLTLADYASPEPDPDSTMTAEDRAGLHAKLYIVENGDETTITLGSGNATGAGLGAKGPRNIEVFATFKGKTAEIGAIGLDGDGFLGAGGIGPLLQTWMPRELRADELAARRFEDAVREARRLLATPKPLLTFEQEDKRLRVSLSVDLPRLATITSIHAQLVTQETGKNLDGEGPWDLGSVRIADATTFVQFDLRGPEGEPASFVTVARATGLPSHEARLQALLSGMITTPEQFFTFITAMLERQPDIGGMVGESRERSAFGSRQPAAPVLESILAAYLADDGPARLKELDRVVGLMKEELAEDSMREFLQLWNEFKKAMGKRK
ncbi:hypothetical protein IB267_32835 [Ensifer sp. ENS09]|uniref:hypothetical protein n=1 Tax=Ensifer sp. ENS09 TaxID=2769263 RepID=UPI00177C1F5E|nr:hypothetical protein [Ensifer sp. ENS09]MBD9653151.1 hypothetical protein [Ensifer sp. ENS09]